MRFPDELTFSEDRFVNSHQSGPVHIGELLTVILARLETAERRKESFEQRPSEETEAQLPSAIFSGVFRMDDAATTAAAR